jgi:hypothetical protein
MPRRAIYILYPSRCMSSSYLDYDNISVDAATKLPHWPVAPGCYRECDCLVGQSPLVDIVDLTASFSESPLVDIVNVTASLASRPWLIS